MVKLDRGCAWLGWLMVALSTLFLARRGEAQELQYSAIDRATVRVLALGLVDLQEVEVGERKVKLASPISGHGSGVVVSKDGLIVTAAHVVADARAVAVHAPGVLGPLHARVVALDETRDIAFLRVAHTFEAVAALSGADDKLAVRQTVFAIGYPLDVTRSDPQSSRGSISGKLPDGRLQLDISVNPGNSGGPVVDEKDRVHGIISARGNLEKGIVGLAVAVPLDAFRARLEAEQQAAQPPAASPGGGQMADLVSIVAHEGGRLMRGSVGDADQAARSEREVRRLVDAMPSSADAALLGAAFFWNRRAAEEVEGDDAAAALADARRLVKLAVKLEPELKRKSKFVKFMLSGAKEEAVEGSTDKPVPGTGHKITFTNKQKDAVLYVKRGEAEVTANVGFQQVVFNASAYEKLCDLPCEVRLPTGKYNFAVSQGSERMLPVKDSVSVDGPTTLEAEYQSKKGLRTGGIGLIVVSAAVGGAVMLLGPNKDCTEVNDPLGYGYPECDYHFTGLYAGGAIMVGGGLIGVVLMSQRDTAAVGAPRAQPGKGAPGSTGASPMPFGLALRGTF